MAKEKKRKTETITFTTECKDLEQNSNIPGDLPSKLLYGKVAMLLLQFLMDEGNPDGWHRSLYILPGCDEWPLQKKKSDMNLWRWNRNRKTGIPHSDDCTDHCVFIPTKDDTSTFGPFPCAIRASEKKVNICMSGVNITNVCMPGYSGLNCTTRCPYPWYGYRCQGYCDCSNDTCDVSTGCRTLTTGL
uniref:EGF-like domain-containing protein n=1 Tax=Magallana gigas TaxID=29159 RepID=K1R8X5_MAGGI